MEGTIICLIDLRFGSGKGKIRFEKFEVNQLATSHTNLFCVKE